MSKAPKVSVIIVNFNGLHWLKKLLPDVKNQTYKNIEVYLVDNGSTDGTLEYLLKNFPFIKLIPLTTNLGFAKANNIGFSESTGSLVVLLNNDTRIPKNYIENFVKVFIEIPTCSIAQSQIVHLSDPNKIDSCGSLFTSTTFQYYIGNSKSKNQPQYQTPFKIFSTKGASMVIKRDVIEKIGFFDDDFWSYYEETDFCHRAWVAGFETWYWPYASIQHAVGGTSLSFKNDFVQFHNYKNKLKSLIVNLEVKNIIKYVPIYFFFTSSILIIWTFTGKFKHSFAVLKSIGWNMIHIKNTWKKRIKVQNLRQKNDNQIFTSVLKNPRLTYYKYLFSNNLSAYAD